MASERSPVGSLIFARDTSRFRFAAGGRNTLPGPTTCLQYLGSEKMKEVEAEPVIIMAEPDRLAEVLQQEAFVPRP